MWLSVKHVLLIFFRFVSNLKNPNPQKKIAGFTPILFTRLKGDYWRLVAACTIFICGDANVNTLSSASMQSKNIKFSNKK